MKIELNISNLDVKIREGSLSICLFNRVENQYIIFYKNLETNNIYFECNDQSNAAYNCVQSVYLDGNLFFIILNDHGIKTLGIEQVEVHLSFSRPMYNDFLDAIQRIFLLLEISSQPFEASKPPVIKYEKIKALDLSGKNLSLPPDDLGNYINLEALNLLANPQLDLEATIEVLAKIGSLKTLKVHIVGKLAANLNKLKSLEMLHIEGAADFETWPEDTEQLKDLNYLYLQSNEDINLPDAITNFSNLTSLEVRAQRWTLPEHFYKLNKLSILDLFYCTNNHFPKEMEQMTSLKKIYLGYNNDRDDGQVLESFSHILSLNTLEIALKEIPESIASLTQLESLTLYSKYGPNHELKITEEFCQLTKLESLKFIGCNNIVFPKNISKLNSLKELIFDRCNFEKLPDGLSLLKNIHTLSINECPNLQYLSEEIANMRSIRRLFINENSNLKTLPIEFNTITYLNEIQLLDNGILENIPDHWLNKLQNEMIFK